MRKSKQKYQDYVTGNIRKNLRRFNISFVDENVIILTKSRVPLYVRIVASLGPKFCYAVSKDDIQESDIFLCMANIQDTCDDPSENYFTVQELKALKNEMNSGLLKEQNYSFAQLYLKDLMLLTKKFLRKNHHLMIIPADKGGKVVIMERIMYEQKVEEHIKKNIDAHNYFYCNNFDFNDIRNLVEREYSALILELNPIFDKDVKNSRQN